MEKCANNAEAIVPWGGKILKGCMQHARNMSALGSVIGSPIDVRTLPPNGEKCEFQDDLTQQDAV